MKNKIIENKLKDKANNTVIEFSSNSIKLAQSTFKRQRAITKLFIQDNIPDSEYEFINTLEKIIKTNNLKIDNLLISLDRSLVTIRFIKLPSIKEEEIENMAQWQAAKLLPYKIDEIVVSHQTIKVDENGFSYVLLVIVPKNIIKKFINVCDTLKLKPQTITLSSEGLLEWYIHLQSDRLPDKALVLIDIEKSKAELAILYQDKFIFSRAFSLDKLQSDNQLKNRIIEEARLSIESYSKQETFQPIDKIVLTGNKNQISDLVPLFKDEFNLSIDVIDHLDNLELQKEITEAGIALNISFASSCGLALIQRLPKINLLPPEVKDKILYLEKRRELFRTICLVLFATLIFAGIFGFNFYKKKKNIEALDRQLRKIDPLAKEIQDIKNRIAIINFQLSNESSCIEIIREIHRITPKEINLNTLIFEEAGVVTIKGIAPTMSLVFSFVPILNDSPFFENVQTRYATQRKIREGELTDFEIICKLSLDYRGQ